ncbi:MAG TPA: hypothetical protein VLE51_01100 [Candidatus Saccharimonadales bacterium]|nr:hypothetical protein [Candidatus Saccharimonadales bacterium]
MNKRLLWGSITIFSIIGSYIPVLWHASEFSAASILGGLIGGLFGIWAAIKLNEYMGG